MSIPNFVEGFPQDGSSLGSTKVQIRNNLDGTFQTLSVDHQNQNQTDPGYHKVIHSPAQTIAGQSSWNPDVTSPAYLAIQATKIAGVQQTFPMNYTPAYVGATADTQLFSMSGNGGLSQLTGNQAAAEGWAWASGILFQWGRVNSTAASGSVSFTTRSPQGINFPNAVFSIAIVPNVAGATNHVSTTYTQNLTTTGFTWYQADRAATQTGFYWIAIGG